MLPGLSPEKVYHPRSDTKDCSWGRNCFLIHTYIIISTKGLKPFNWLLNWPLMPVQRKISYFRHILPPMSLSHPLDGH